ncbi:hypothetical protein vBAfQDWS535_08 [Alcaligenes phage vB_Af_QDWS535]|nr:hypothetical protein vBAfQDWS535_08 [Alcaligenes phage vB_Af_QDWS535]
MGFKTSDLRPAQITPITPPAKSHLYKIFEIADRAYTDELVAMLPAQATIVDFKLFAEDGATASGDVTVTVKRGADVVATGTVDLTVLATSPSPVLYFSLAGLPNIVNTPERQDLAIHITTATVVGGPFKVITEFVQ